MSEITALQLDGHIAQNKTCSVYLIYGSQSALISECTGKLKNALMPDFPEINFMEFDGKACSIRDIEACAQQAPMLAACRLISICDFSAAERSENDMDKLVSVISSLDSETTLIFWFLNVSTSPGKKSGDDGKNRKWQSLLNAVKKYGCCIRCDMPDKNDMVRVLCEKAQREGVKLRDAEALFLINRTGMDYSLLVSQLNMLISVAPRKSITTELIEKLIEPGIEANIFYLAGRILSGDYDKAFDILERLFLQREESGTILRILQGPFIDLYRAKSAMEAGLSLEQTIELYPSDYPKNKRFLMENARRDCTKYPISLLRQYITIIYNAERSMHGSRLDDRLILEKLISELCCVRKKEGRG